MLERVASFRKPLIGSVNGLGVGIGMTILAHCDLVLMATTARLAHAVPPVRPGSGGRLELHLRPPGRLGEHAAWILLSGRWFTAQECLDMGFVWRVCEPDRLEAETMAVARELAANPIPSLVATKELMLAAGHRSRRSLLTAARWPPTPRSSGRRPTGRRWPPSRTSASPTSAAIAGL